MPKLVISVVEFLNTAPLVWGFTNGPLAGKYDLSFTVPSLCAEALASGHADVAIIPSIEYQRISLPGGTVVLPGLSVAAKGEVRSLLLLSKKPIEMAQRIALDSSSRSTAALVQILCREHWKTAPEFLPAAPDPAAMLKIADAALIIGDPALRISLQFESLAGKKHEGKICCGGDPGSLPVPGFETLFVYDMAHAWRDFTGRPCVLAIWVGRREVITPEVVADFRAAADYGRARIVEISELAEARVNMPSKSVATYLMENIDYTLDAENLAGLRLYFEKAAAAGLIPAVRPMEFAS